jgi:hypothetical protein
MKFSFSKEIVFDTGLNAAFDTIARTADSIRWNNRSEYQLEFNRDKPLAVLIKTIPLKIGKDISGNYYFNPVYESVFTSAGFSQPQDSGFFLTPIPPENAVCTLKGSIYQLSVRGNYFGKGIISGSNKLLLWVNPSAGGWYLQRPPNGISLIQPDGTWLGYCQLGNEIYHPHDDDIINIAVSVTDSTTAKRLMNKPGVVIESIPIGNRINYSGEVTVKLK